MDRGARDAVLYSCLHIVTVKVDNLGATRSSVMVIGRHAPIIKQRGKQSHFAEPIANGSATFSSDP